jgi:hypothetical protein
MTNDKPYTVTQTDFGWAVTLQGMFGAAFPSFILSDEHEKRALTFDEQEVARDMAWLLNMARAMRAK